MWKEMKNQYFQRKKELEETDWEGSISWQIASRALEAMNEIENENRITKS